MSGKYEIILADFPWSGYTPFGTAKIGYNTMSTVELIKFPWQDFMAKQCVIFLWVTGPMMFKQQSLVIDSWIDQHKLEYQGMPYIWVKTKKDGKTPIGASGPRPRLVKPVTEFVIALSNVKGKRPFPLLTESQKQLVFAPKPYSKKGEKSKHSTKPVEVHRRIVELLGDRPRVELFARAGVPGWDTWGDEAPKEDASGEVEHIEEKSGVKRGKPSRSRAQAQLIRLAKRHRRLAG